MFKEKLIKIDKNVYELIKQDQMNVPGRIYANENILSSLDDNVLIQIRNVASLPGIQKYSIAMPDAHWGYGFPIGGVAAFSSENGIISPGGIGYDINCGIRMLGTGLVYKDIRKYKKDIVDNIFSSIPTGVGRGGLIRLSKNDMTSVLEKGAQWAVECGFGESLDIKRCEDNGKIDGADSSLISERAIERGSNQLGSLGGGNHFIEFDIVDKVFDRQSADILSLSEGEIVILIHTGSRGLGHQVTTDWVRKLEKYSRKKNIKLPDRQLVYTPSPSKSSIGSRYFSSMKAAANFAFANRQMITDRIRKVMKNFFSEANIEVIYDCCHNIAKEEIHFGRKMFVHRKGATRAFPPKKGFGLENIGTPVILPGSMGTGAYLLKPTEKTAETFASLAHGAGRLLSRKAASRSFNVDKIKKILLNKDIYIRHQSRSGVVEEAPEAYKSMEEVVKTIIECRLADIIVRTVPIGNIKG